MSSATIYLSSLNGNADQLDVLAEFSGAKVPLPSTSVPIVPTANAGTINRDALAGSLTFNTTHMAGSGNNPASITGVEASPTSDLILISKTAMAADTVGVSSKLGLNTRPNTDFLGQLSKEIFGSEHSSDLFNNQRLLSEKYEESCDNLNYQVEQSTDNEAAIEVVNALMLERPARFALNYNASATGNITSGPGVAGVHTSVMFKGSTSGVSKEVTVEMNDAGTQAIRMTKETEGAFRQKSTATSNEYVQGAMTSLSGMVRGTYAVDTTSKRWDGSAWTTVTHAEAAAVTFTVDVAAGGKNGNIASVTVLNAGSGYLLDDIIIIAASQLGAGSISRTLEFNVTGAMLVGNKFKNNAGILQAFQSVFIGDTTYGSSTTKLANTSVAIGAGDGGGSAGKINVVADGSTINTLSSVIIHTAGSGYAEGNNVALAANAMFTGLGAVTILLTANMVNSGALSAAGSGAADWLAAIQAFTGANATTPAQYNTVPKSITYSDVALQTSGGSGAQITVVAGSNVNAGITAVTVTTAGTGYVAGQLLQIPSGTMGTDSATITITLTAAMISGGVLQTGSALLDAIKAAGSGVLSVSIATYTTISLTSSHQGKGAEMNITLNGPTSLESVVFSKHGSGYRSGDTVIVPAATLGASSAAITFVVTDRMLLASGGLPILTLPTFGSATVTNNSGHNPTGAAGTTRDGEAESGSQGTGAIFKVVVSAAGAVTDIIVTAAGSGYRNGDILSFTGLGGATFTYKLQAAAVNSAFVNEVITSTAGDGVAVGGVGNSAVITSSAAINSIQKAILNGSLSDGAQDTQVPLEVNDTIQIKYQITSKTGQQNAAQQPISVLYDAIFEFILI